MIYSSPQQILINLLLITNYYALYMELGTLYPTQLHLDPRYLNSKGPKLDFPYFKTCSPPASFLGQWLYHTGITPDFLSFLHSAHPIDAPFLWIEVCASPVPFSPLTADSHSSPAASTMATLLPVCPSTAPTCRTKSCET